MWPFQQYLLIGNIFRCLRCAHTWLKSVEKFRFAFVSGGSNTLCCWLRLSKLFISSKILLRGYLDSPTERKGSSSRRKLIRLACTVFAVAHICACTWFYIGTQYLVTRFYVLSWCSCAHLMISLQFWFPRDGVTWYTVDNSLRNISFTDHDKIGMQEGSSIWAKYLLSIYWVAATLTSNG